MKIMFFYVVPQVGGNIYYGRVSATVNALTDETFDWAEVSVMDLVPEEVRLNAVASRAQVTGTAILEPTKAPADAIEEAAKRAYLADSGGEVPWVETSMEVKDMWRRIAKAARDA